MKHKIGEQIVYATEHYKVVGFDLKKRRYCLEPAEGDVVENLANQIWVDSKDID